MSNESRNIADQTAESKQGQQENPCRLRRTVRQLLSRGVKGINFFGNIIRIIQFFDDLS